MGSILAFCRYGCCQTDVDDNAPGRSAPTFGSFGLSFLDEGGFGGLAMPMGAVEDGTALSSRICRGCLDWLGTSE